MLFKNGVPLFQGLEEVVRRFPFEGHQNWVIASRQGTGKSGTFRTPTGRLYSVLMAGEPFFVAVVERPEVWVAKEGRDFPDLGARRRLPRSPGPGAIAVPTGRSLPSEER